MSVLTQRRKVAAPESPTKPDDGSVSTRSESPALSSTSSTCDSPVMSRPSSSPSSTVVDLKSLDVPAATTITTGTRKFKSLKERSEIPSSFYITVGIILLLHCSTGMWKIETLERWYSSLKQSVLSTGNILVYLRDLVISAASDNPAEWTEYAKTAAMVLLCSSLLGIFFVAPLMAGLWTGRKARRHKFHRYMGLSFLTHYALAWVEFCTDYETSTTSYLCHIVAVTGIIQGWSAYFSFKVLPELNDAGYYADKAVLSRNFVHENIYFTLITIFGTMYYNPEARAVLRSNLGGRFLEYLFVFVPFVVLRPWFPITRFSNAGQTYKGRTLKNEKFYQIGTVMVKFFYLWAKYFLGFFMQFMIFLDLVKDQDWQYMHGMLLLNTGTVSLAVFLHTLRFKKVLPAKFTFSIYLVQIYLTFTAVPIILSMFISHPKLCVLCSAGLLVNLTKSRKLHAIWCGCCMILLNNTNIQW